MNFTDKLAQKRAANFKSDIVAPPPKPPKKLDGVWANEYLGQSQTEQYQLPAPPKHGDRRLAMGGEQVYVNGRWEMTSGFERRGEKIPQSSNELVVKDSRSKALSEIYSRVNKRLKNDGFQKGHLKLDNYQ